MGSKLFWLNLVQISVKEMHTIFENYKETVDENLQPAW